MKDEDETVRDRQVGHDGPVYRHRSNVIVQLNAEQVGQATTVRSATPLLETKLIDRKIT